MAFILPNRELRGYKYDDTNEVMFIDANGRKMLVSSIETGKYMAELAHAAGEYFIYKEITSNYRDSVLCRAKTNIAVGDTLTAGTNYEVVTVTGQINELKSSISGKVDGYQIVDGLLYLMAGQTRIGEGIRLVNDNYITAEALAEALGGVVVSVKAADDGIRVTYGDERSERIKVGSEGLPFDGGYVDGNGLLHLTLDGVDVENFTPFVVPSYGGQTAGDASISRVVPATIDCVYGEDMLIDFTFSAVDSGGDPVGNGTGTWSVGGIAVAKNVVVTQGLNSFNIGPYLTAGENTVKLAVTVDTGGSAPVTATKTWTVNAISMYFSWNYDDTQVHSDAFTDRITVFGDISKTVHTSIDGVETDPVVTSRTNYQMSLPIPALSHGAHGVERWLTAAVNSTEQRTQPQYHEMIFAEDGNDTPIIAIGMKNRTMNQYDTLRIPIVIYDPTSMTANATLAVNGDAIASWTGIGRTRQYWNYTPTSSGEHVLTITCGSVSRSITLTVEEVDIQIEEATNYTFKFKCSELPTNDAARAWNSNGVSAAFSDNFDWINGGLRTERVVADTLEEADENTPEEDTVIQQYMCVKAGTRMTINHKLFGTDPRSAGMNFKMIFKVKNCRNYDAEIVRCYADSVGLRMYAHNAVFNSTGTSVSVPYGEDEFIELEFDVYPAPRQENDGNYRYIMAWIDGVITTCRVYGANDSFVQSAANQQNIIIGSDDCDVYVYLVKAYPAYLTRDAHIDNFIADAPSATEMVDRYRRNDILDASGEIDYMKLANANKDCRVYLWDIPYLTVGKKDKVSGCSFHQFWVNGDKYFELSGVAVMTVQGTSSVDYILGAANTDANFVSLEDGNGHDLLANGVKDETYGNNWYVEDEENPGHAKVFIVQEGDELGPECIAVERDASRNVTKYIKALGYKVNEDSCPISYSNTKVNFASCEQVNNMCNAIWYQRYNPYPSLTPRDCMEFSMGVQFIRDSGTVPDAQHFVLFGDDKYHFYSIANMGTSKKNVHVFHDLSNPLECCIEVNNNLNDQCRMISDDLSQEDWSGDHYFGMRYPDTKNPSQAIRNGWQRFLSWMAQNNPGAATGDALSTPETYGPYTFRGHDRTGTQVLRGTTVTQYAGTYTHDTFERRMAKMLSECEDYMVMDSVMYHYCFIERRTCVDNVSKNTFWSSTDCLHWDLSKAYDMDTSCGNNNEGQLTFDYGNEYDDTIGAKTVFNAADSVWFQFCAHLYEAAQTMFINRESAGAWSAKAYHAFLLSEQKKIPERVWVQCYWRDYLRTYEQNINAAWMSFLDGGQKTHQRKHYEDFQEPYMSSKYRGTACTSQNVTVRAYTPSNGSSLPVPPKSEVSVKMYNKMYIVVRIDQIYRSVKAERGQTYTINFDDVGTLNDTVINIYSAQMIQEIGSMAALYPGFCSFSNAKRLRSLQIGSDVAGYANPNLESLEFGNNGMLEYLYAQNLPNANSALDLTNCPALLYLDARGSGFTGYDFAPGGLLEEAHLEKPTSLSLISLAYLLSANFEIEDFSALSTLRIENCPGIDSLALVQSATALLVARILGVDWALPDTTILDALYGMQGLDDGGYTIPRAVLSGAAFVPTMRQRNLDQYNAAWPSLEVTYTNMTEQYAVRFYNADGTTIKDRLGNDYVQYIDRGGTAYDPVEAGEVTAPTKASDAQYNYTFNGWTGLSGAVLANRAVTASYATQVRTYTVRWYAQPGTLLRQQTGVAYGSCVQYNAEDPYDFPALTDEEDAYIYKVFLGWDKSTGHITGDTDVYAIWDRAPLPEAGTVSLEDMTVAQISAVAKNKACAQHFEAYDHTDIQVGRDYNFSNVQSQVLVAEPTYFDGTEAKVITTAITLFDADAPSFTLAIDYEFVGTDANACLLSCFDENGNEGFRLRFSSHPNLQWGDASLNVGYTNLRSILTLRHEKGSNILYVGYNNVGNGIYNGQAVEATTVRARATSTDALLTIGAVTYGDGTHDYIARGWVYWAKIWFEDLGAPDTKAMASWPHETWRVHYNGLTKRLAGNTATAAAGEFIFNAPLSEAKRMNATSTNVGGWDESEVRPFINGQVFDALPVSWQSMIQKVKVNASAGNKSTEITISEDRMYLPAFGECFDTNDPTYLAEATGRIPFFTQNYERIKFCGFTLPDDTNYITDAQDPTLYPTYTVEHGKTVWINTSKGSNGYLYVDEEYCQKHAWAGNRALTSTDNLVAQGAQGGRWILARYWWLRSPDLGYSSIFRTILTNGSNIYGSGASTAYGLACGFSI